MQNLSAAPVNLLSWLDAPRADAGVHVAGGRGGWSYTPYPDLADEVRRFAALLRSTEAAPGSVVILLAVETRSFVIAFQGALAAGLTPSPVAPPRSYRTTKRYLDHLSRIFAVAEPSVVVTQGETHEAAQSVLRETGGKAVIVSATPPDAPERRGEPQAEIFTRADEDLALLQFTSGSIGNPKGVRVSWSALNANAAAIRDWLRIEPRDVWASWLPLFHDMGLIGAMITPIASQIGLRLLTPEQFIRSPERWLECFGRHGATITTAPSFGYAYSARRVRPEQLAGFDLSAWRVAILGAERIDPVAVADFAALTRPFGFRETALTAAYGLAEATLAVSGVPPAETSPLVSMAPGQSAFGEPVRVNGSGVLGVDRAEGNWLTGCGQPVGDFSVRILDEEGVPLPEGRFGEIAVRGSSVADGYLHADGHVSAFGPEGLRTGDGGFLWQGQLYVAGRIADSIKVRGSAVFAEDLEVELAALPGLSAGRLVVLLGYHDGAAHAVLLVEAVSAEGWLDQAVNVMQASTTTQAQISVLLGRKGAIKRTSSGKPRRRSLWQDLLAGMDTNLRVAYGTPPGPRPPQPAPANSEGLSS